MISFIIPAHNEAQHLPQTLRAIFASAGEVGEPFEVIVVDDSSTDGTDDIAREAGARVVRVEHRHIAATRNAGARVAEGELLFFIDADTVINAAALQAACEAIRRGAVGGGCVYAFDGVVPLWARIILPPAIWIARRIKLVGGCCLFCTRSAFDAVAGFPEQYYAAEELPFIRALKKRGRFVIPGPLVITSGRKLRQFSGASLFRAVLSVLFHGPKKYRDRTGLEIWYGERRPDLDEAKHS